MKKPIVAVVGRPNVGKSTLFNKLIQKRIAITEGTPGVTRDRLYQEAEWLNRKFILVDTGGLEPDKTDTIPKHILAQAEIAMESADVILFVVDGKEGLTNQDRDISNILRKSKKPVLLVINKVDTHRTPSQVYEFYELGYEHLMVISAEQGLGLGDLLDEIVSYFPKTKEISEEDEVTRIAIIGKPNVGKSSLINRILKEERMIVTDIAGTTRDAIDTNYQHKGQNYILIDTAGLRRKRAIIDDLERYAVVRTLSAIDRSDICILVIDAQSGVTEQDAKIVGYAHDNGKAIIILVNKWDLIEKDNQTYYQYEQEIRSKLSFAFYAPMLFASVKTGQRIDKLFDLVEMVNNNYHLRISTGLLNEILNDAILHNPPPTDKGVRLKILYGTQVSVCPPKFLLFVNKKELMHFSYLRYIENQIRKKFGFEGTPLKFDLKTRDENKK